ncbi:tyrosine-type recombinase/integrase [Nakamurella sp. UYEF19]|uniref:tyrosine-type recombinase/integrase n=1 Tax=Nakamurella sp. UYEF19 TaxID=1756392 RepID=UPI003397E2F5
MSRDVLTLTRLSSALTAAAGPDAAVEQLSRAVVERFMLLLGQCGLSDNGRGIALSSASVFFNVVRQHDWLPTLPTQTAVYPDDFPRRQLVAGRAVPEFVMGQIENPDNLAKVSDPGHRLLITVLIQTGLRLGDAARLGLDCVVNDQQQAPYLRYHNYKMKRDALVPIGVELAAAINAHANTMTRNGGKVLFPRSERSQDPGAAVTNGMAAMWLRNWLVDCAFHDEQGQLVHLTAHQFRHTLATRLINKDVPQEVVRKILDHSSTQMTAHYARLHDSTVRRHWERARKVTIDGQPVLISQDSPLADGVWMKHHLAKATTSLPNGYCGLPLQQSCPHANACLTCPVFITTPEFLGQHREQLAHTQLVLAGARKNGRLRLIEMNERVAANLTTIIATLETEDTTCKSELNDAR